VPKGTLLAVGLIVLVCFVAGLLARTKLAKKLVKGLDSEVLSKVPAYEYFKEVSKSMLGVQELGKHPVVLAQFGGAWRIGIQVDGINNGLVTVFIPDAPNPHSGAVYFMPPDQVRPAGVPLAATLNCLKRFGAGSSALIHSHIT
jgi:uncharacterized membrane protein